MAKPNKPQNVVDHEHFWPSEEDRETDARRYDACLLADGSAVIWVVHEDRVIPCQTFADARYQADAMAHLGV